MTSKTVSTKNSKTSVTTTKKPSSKRDYYDEWRPPPGVRYQLSQTNVDFDAKVPKVKLQYTTVEYEPGQDLSPPETVVIEHYAKQRGRGPVFKFQEEIEDMKIRNIQKELIKIVLKRGKKREKQIRLALKGLHNKLMRNIGPIWFHELSPKQMRSADKLKDAMMKDFKRETIINTQETLGDLGIVLWPNHTKIEYALKKFYQCPVEFLLTIFQLNRPKEPEIKNEYTLNDRIMLSAVVHLSIRETFRELHLRIPSPPNINESPTTVKNSRNKPRRNKWTKVKWHKGMSPYLKPLIPVEQKHKEGEYKNRHKEYASLEYFDYIEDMYDVFYEDDPESVKKRKQASKMKKTRWNRPPSIPVRFIESKMKKRRVCQLKKPSPYISPCKKLKMKKEPEPEPEQEPEEEEEPPNICRCSPQTFNEDTAFNLNIKITTSEDEYHLTQKLCPYSSKNTIGEINLVEHNKIKKQDRSTSDIDGTTFKRIEYRCECCSCGKTVNIFPEENSSIGAKNMSNIKQFINCQTCLNPITEEEGMEMYEEYEMEHEESSESDICKCVSRSEETSSTDIDDPYYLCTCKSSSDSCTCCICGQMDKDFLIKIRRYNEAFKTNHKPCLCACKCKKRKKKPCCGDDTPPCKYCFCKKKVEVELEGEEEEEETKEDREAKIEEQIKLETLKTKEVTIEDPAVEDTVLEDKVPPVPSEDLNMCDCEKLYTKFLDAHESCMSLFASYQKKIQEDVEEYLKDIKENRCLCGDSISSDNEANYDEEEAQFLEEIHGEESSDSCICQKEKTCCCSCMQPKDFYSGCTCNQTAGCTCNTSESTTEESSSSEECCCACTCGQGPCKCEEFLLKVKEEKARMQSEREQSILNTSKKSLVKDEPEDLGSEEESEKVEEPDPRIMILDKFPTKPKEQMKLLKTALAALAEDGYPLARLPDVHRLPHFQVWLDKRTRKYVSMDDRDALYAISKSFWNHIEICQRKVDIPDMPLTTKQAHHCTYAGIYKYKRLISGVKTDYGRRVKQAYISQAQELFPSMYHYQLPNKTFRDVYFSYLASDENHIHVFKPWQPHERKDMSTRQPC